MAELLIIFVFLSAVVALGNWRLGLALLFVTGMMQDPIRKVTPNTPPYLTLACVPIYLAMLAGLWTRVEVVGTIRRYYPELIWPVSLFAVALVGSGFRTLSYGLHALPVLVLGIVSYGLVFPGLVLGFFYVRKDLSELDGPLMVAVGLTALMLIGVPLEYYEVDLGGRWLGTVAISGAWLRWYSETEYVRMISGFYRSPEIMGWHAAMMSMAAFYLSIRRPRLMPLGIALITWGLTCTLLSARRKMFFMLFVYLLLFLAMTGRRWRGFVVTAALVVCTIVTFAVLFFVDENYLKTAHSGVEAAGERLSRDTMTGPFSLLFEVGLIGFGVGSLTQGSQHLAVSIPKPSVEGGLQKIMVELGVFGGGVVLWFLVVLGLAVFRAARHAIRNRLDPLPSAGFLAFVGANLSAFIVAHQVFGDPFILSLVGLAIGIVLSTVRLARRRRGTGAPKEVETALAPGRAVPQLTASATDDSS